MLARAIMISTESSSVSAISVSSSKKVRSMDVLRVKKLSENAQLPKKGSALAAGYDLCRYHDAQLFKILTFIFVVPLI